MGIKYLFIALWEQGPPLRFFRNFFITRNAWGMFYKSSCIRKDGKSKVRYNSKASALKAADSMSRKHGNHFSVYRCIFCGGLHLGKNRDNK